MHNNCAYKNECKKIMHSQNAQQFFLHEWMLKNTFTKCSTIVLKWQMNVKKCSNNSHLNNLLLLLLLLF
jgi:phosphopantetheinyl transferase